MVLKFKNWSRKDNKITEISNFQKYEKNIEIEILKIALF